ncbi:hypothetical protein YOLOSWAG_247 [Erwinia phage vB_EamM_Yoloswag]|uniref:Uncharacterized protein n=1 Tax=Erwinia phage vB_EamM_Yoloswag TaxID=1958956 RepID=A0A1S6L3T7_9CAUD|nr:hypothetical protein HOR66_gp247 [Erwinia phage vB_EamM_Yoloswag]AQT28819.1 hypothetical protein YOLOSWAG_247 [Erwinia phage vB_EamM_Yoloswag]
MFFYTHNSCALKTLDVLSLGNSPGTENYKSVVKIIAEITRQIFLNLIDAAVENLF